MYVLGSDHVALEFGERCCCDGAPIRQNMVHQLFTKWLGRGGVDAREVAGLIHVGGLRLSLAR